MWKLLFLLVLKRTSLHRSATVSVPNRQSNTLPPAQELREPWRLAFPLVLYSLHSTRKSAAGQRKKPCRTVSLAVLDGPVRHLTPRIDNKPLNSGSEMLEDKARSRMIRWSNILPSLVERASVSLTHARYYSEVCCFVAAARISKSVGMEDWSARG